MSRRRATPAAQSSLTELAVAGAQPPTVRVATYRRASTDETNQPFTLEAQDASLQHHIASQPGWTRVADYVERASGKDIDGRPELQKLLTAAARGEFDVVLVMKLDRWSRRLVDAMLSWSVGNAAPVGAANVNVETPAVSPFDSVAVNV